MSKRLCVTVLLMTVAAIVIRGIGLSSNPPGLYVDEAALGYNAYSISQTGRDEYNFSLPTYLRSFGTYTPALVVYLIIIPIRILGLSVLSLRATPLIIGSLTVISLAILSTRLIKSSFPVFLITGIVTALAPSHILFSRGFYEPTLGLLLFTLGLAKRPDTIIGLILLSLSTYAYQPQRLIVFLFIACFFIFVRKIPWSKLTIFLISQLPQFYLSTQSGPNTRLISQLWLPQTGHNLLLIIREFVSQYTAYLSPSNLFWFSDPDPQRSLPFLSVFFPWQIIPYLVGLFWIINRYKHYRVLVITYLLFPVAAALTKDPFSTMRASLLFIPVTMVIVTGILLTIRKLNRVGRILASVLLLGLSWGHLYRSLFILLPNQRYLAWNYGYQQLFTKINAYSIPVLVDLDKPSYVQYLFFNKINPNFVQSLAPYLGRDYYRSISWQDYFVTSRVSFRHLDWRNDIYKDQLIVGGPNVISQSQAKEHFLKLEFTIPSPLGESILFAYRTDPAFKCASQTVKPGPCLLK